MPEPPRPGVLLAGLCVPEKVSPATTISRMKGHIAGQSPGTASLIEIAPGALTGCIAFHARL